MSVENPDIAPDGALKSKAGDNINGRDEILLGISFYGDVKTLPPYLEIDGVQIHPERITDSNTLPQNFTPKQILELEKKRYLVNQRS